MVRRQFRQAVSVQIEVVPADCRVILFGALRRRERQDLRQLDQTVAVNIRGVDIVAADGGNGAFRFARGEVPERAVLKRKYVGYEGVFFICARYKDSLNLCRQASGQNPLDCGRTVRQIGLRLAFELAVLPSVEFRNAVRLLGIESEDENILLSVTVQVDRAVLRIVGAHQLGHMAVCIGICAERLQHIGG